MKVDVSIIDTDDVIHNQARLQLILAIWIDESSIVTPIKVDESITKSAARS
jgi:hypothetical protein